MLSSNCMMLYLFLILHVGDFENCEQSFKMPYKHFPTLTKPNDDNMSKIQIFSVLINLIQLQISSRIVGDIVEDHHQFSKKIVDLFWWFQLSSQQDLHRTILFQDIVKLIYQCFILVIFLELLSSFLFVFDSHGLLSFFSWQFLSLFPFLHLNLILNGSPLIIHFYSFLFIFDLVRFFLICSLELLHGLGLWFDFRLLFSLRLVRMRRGN